jgi:GT2 family glycosyltransferase
LEQVFEDIKVSTDKAIKENKIKSLMLYVVDNTLNTSYSNQLKDLLLRHWGNSEQLKIAILDKNKGYGHAHNQVLSSLNSDYHIFLNPDVLIQENALVNAIDYMQNNPDVGLITPNASTEKGEKLYLLKRYPSVIILFVRGFFPMFCRTRLFKGKSESYEMRDINQSQNYKGVDIASGCFMFFRTKDIKNKFKFSEKFFLYFEDYDLSWQFSMYRKIAYVPSVKIIHYGGNAAQKGGKHIRYFMRSAITFYNRFGWKFI